MLSRSTYIRLILFIVGELLAEAVQHAILHFQVGNVAQRLPVISNESTPELVDGQWVYLNTARAKYSEGFNEQMNMSYNAAYVDFRAQQCQWKRRCFLGICKYSTEWMRKQEVNEYDSEHRNPYDNSLKGGVIMEPFAIGDYIVDHSIILQPLVAKKQDQFTEMMIATTHHVSNFSRTNTGSGFRYMGGGTFFRPHQNREIRGIELGALSFKKSQALMNNCVPGDARIDIFGFRASSVSVIGKVYGKNISADYESTKGFISKGIVPAEKLIRDGIEGEIAGGRYSFQISLFTSLLLTKSIESIMFSLLQVLVVNSVRCFRFWRRVAKVLITMANV